MKSKENSVLSRHSTLRILLLALFVSLRVWAVLDGDIVANRYSDVSRAMRLHYNSIHSSNNANTSESSDRSDGSTRTSLIRNYRNRVGHVVSTSESTSKYLDISGLNRVLQVDIDKKTILAEGNCNMETIFEAGLANGLVPKVFPELKEITVGGAIVGAGLETSSFMYGQFNDICRKIYVLLGNGTIVKCTANEESSISFESLNTTKTTTCPDSDLYHALAGSYGTLGTVLCAEIECVPAKPWVDLTIKSFRNNTAGLRYMQQRCDSYDEKRLDFIEGIQFPSEKKQILGDLAIISGRMTSGEDSGNETKVEYYYPCKSHSEWFYEKIQMVSKQLLRATSGQLDAEGSHTLRIPLKEFMFRYYRGAFWMARYVLLILGYIIALYGE